WPPIARQARTASGLVAGSTNPGRRPRRRRRRRAPLLRPRAGTAEMRIRIAIIGYGKIARDQHLPSIRADDRFELVAVSTRSGDPGLGLPCFPDSTEMFEAMRGRLDAVAICTPPIVRHTIGKAALQAGLHVLLEKPPAATLGEIEDLE